MMDPVSRNKDVQSGKINTMDTEFLNAMTFCNSYERELQGLKSAIIELSFPKGSIVTWGDETPLIIK
jgi:hypothetical protein